MNAYVIAGHFSCIVVMPTLRFPPSVVRRRSPALIYGADERPPLGTLLLLAAQHSATAIAFLSYVLVATRAAGLDAEGTQSMLAMTLIGMAICTALQAWGGRWGSGFLLSHVPNPFVISFVATTLAAFGPGGMPLIALVYCAITLGLAPLVTRMRSVFPTIVVGVVVAMGGLALVESAVRHSLGLNAQWQIHGESAAVAACTLLTIVVASVWGGKRLSLMALLLGIAAGLLVSAWLGQLQGAQAIGAAAWLQLPALHMPSFQGDVGTLVAIGLIAMLTQLDTLGNVSMMDKLEDADWRRINMPAVSGGMRAHALGDFVAGMFGGFPTCTCSTNIALAHATHATSRIIGLVTAVVLALAAFVPKITVSLMQIPVPVLGAVELYASAFLIVAGMELIASRAMDSRSTFAVGLAMSAGIAVMAMPQMMNSVPAYWRSLFGNALVVAGLLVIALNLLFRLGTSRKAHLDLAAGGSGNLHQDITSFVEMQGAAWGARRDVVQRAALAALEAAEGIEAAGRKLMEIRGSFDEFNFDLELLHSGAALPLAAKGSSKALSPEELLEADDADFEAALSQVSSQLLRHIADRVSTYDAQSGQPSGLQLHFAH